VLGFDDSSPSPAVEEQAPVAGPPAAHAVEGGPGQTLTLPEAITLAFQVQPRLREYLETVQQARAQQEVAFSPFLPTLSAGYSVGGFHLDVGGEGFPIPACPKGPLPLPSSPPGAPCPWASPSTRAMSWRS